jgi:hypothetical protein
MKGVVGLVEYQWLVWEMECGSILSFLNKSSVGSMYIWRAKVVKETVGGII